MRWFYGSMMGCLFLAAMAAAYLAEERRQLEAFCQGLTPGVTQVEVRRAAEESGFIPKGEPYTQLRIETGAWSWHSSPPACRAFFNRNRTLEYRVWQS